ncbi:baculoviral IAP repeat-containing protein 6 isoform X1 [Octopus sinensis]|uniref:Dual E2 ubiquitin-conjugating enzyme/E3 ubiquitin-protein ligase BIRC6 n=1 Tax=Octopus sinensis TaxID=2607531 RepID=A0A6P7SHC3_9MOLL|nr:baculoviral IAP repeat-containing protein 6 isoform X1 [Octopus sinensis]
MSDVIGGRGKSGNTKMATTVKWYVGEDGCLSVGEAATGVTYHPTLNTIIVATKAHTLKVYDVTSGCLLKESNLSATNTKSNKLKCMYLQEKDRMIICEGTSVCARKDLNGVLLLDTALQTPVSKTEDLVKVELLLAEANQLLKSLAAAELPGIDYVDDFLKELDRAVDSMQELAKANHKTAKWATVCIQLPHCALKTVCSNVVAEMKRLNQHRPGLSIAAAISNRLSYLLPSSLPEIGSGPVERSLMYSEAARRETFGKWPHMNYKWALPDPMAQAGFYHQPNSIGDDRAMCFTCNVCLVCWEPTDEPWSEHERHSTSCPFVKGEYTQNVPLLVTYATQPALLHGEPTDKIECISTSSSKHFFATSTLNGNVVIWSTARLLKKHCQFNLDPTEPVVAAKTGVQFEMEPIPTVDVDSRHKSGRMDQQLKTERDRCPNELLTEESYTPECVAVNITDPREIPLSDELYTRDQKCWKQTRPSQDIKVHSLCMMEKPDHLMIESKGGGTAGEGGGGNECSNGNSGECNVRASTKYLSQPSLVCGVSLRKTRPSCNVLHHETELNADFPVKPDVQFMNKVNEVVSSDTLPPKIIPDLLDDCDNVTLLDRMVFLPFIIVVAIWHEKAPSVKPQDNNSKPSTSGNELSVPTLGSIAMTQDWGMLDPMFDSVPDTDALLVEEGSGSKPLVNTTTLDSNLEDTKMSNSNSSMSDISEANKSLSMDNLFKQTQPLLPNGHILQCVELPRNLQSETLKISSINLTTDGLYVIVVLSPVNICDSFSIVIDNKNLSKANSPNNPNKQGQSAETATNSNNISLLADTPASGTILVYRLNFDHEHVRIEETPVNSLLIPSVFESVVNLAVIPNEFMGQAEDEDSTSIDNHHSRSSEPHGLFGTVLYNGHIKLWDLSTLTSVAQIEPEEGDKFTSLTCCTGLDRLCACTMGGKLHFYQLSEQNPAILEMSNCGIFNNKEALSDLDSADAGNDEVNEHQKTKQTATEESLFAEPLTTEKLMRLHSLTEFENLMPRFSATVSPCWAEIQQEQQQRRHPQHLQQQGEATQHTRTWKLQPESNTWDEHLFELVLPRPCTVGHIDVKFTLLMNMYSTLPNIQVTLLKQNIGNIGKQQPPAAPDTSTSTLSEKESTATTSTSTTAPTPTTTTGAKNGLNLSTATSQNPTSSDYVSSVTIDPKPFVVEVDQKLDFNLHPRPNLLNDSTFNGKSEVNNVLDPLFLEMLNAEILCGPLPVSSCLDLSGSSALVTLTSPQLLNSKSRSFLLHIKGFFTKGEDSPDKAQASENKKKSTTLNNTTMFDKQKVKSIKSLFDNIPYPGFNTTERVSSAPKMKLENIQGCDWIQELSITVRKTKKTRVPKERWHRNMMIESADFHENLLCAVTNPNQNHIHTSEDHHENLALDILCWVTAVQMNDPSRKIPDCTVLVTVKKELLSLVKACFIHGTRTTAHKASRLLVLCMELCKSSPDPDVTPSFSYSLLQALLECLPLLPSGYSAGALRWFFTLLNIVKQMNDSLVAEKCVSMLTKVAKCYYNRDIPLHSLLKARYGLQGHPFDPDLFDIYPANSLRQSSSPYTYTSAAATNTPAAQSFQPPPQQDEMDYYDLFNQLSDKQCDKFPSEYLRHNILGLLEVEPLHFTCHATSDSTKMERLDSGPSGSSSIPIVGSSGLSGTVNFGESLSNVATTGATMASLPSSLAMAEQQVQQLATKVQQSKKDVESIKQLLSTVLKTVKPAANNSSDQAFKQQAQNPKTTPLFMTPPLSPPNENWPATGPPYLSAGVPSDNGPLYVKVPSLLGDKNQNTEKSDNKQRVQMVLPHLLQPPSPQVLVVERMHSGARRFVILDLGKPVLLTDVIIPACADLASLSIDVWVQSEETDGQRLVIASDIGIRSLIMNNIMPPPICRYLKITTIGRYGGSATRSKIPVGSFYGHSFIFPWEWNSYLEHHGGVSGSNQASSSTATPSSGQEHQQQQQMILSQLGLFLSLLEDIQCRYSLTKTQLDTLLTSLLASQSASDHVQCYLQKNPKKNVDDKITCIYNDCLQLQLQLNLCHHAIDRLQRGLGLSVIKKDSECTDLNEQLKKASTDKLRFLLECLLETLISTTNGSSAAPQLSVSLLTSLSPPTCEALFRHMCISGTKRIQILTGMLLVRVCGTQPWWGKFLGNILQRFFHSEYKQVFPQDRVFVLLTALGQKSLMGPMAVNILESLLGMLVHAVAPLMPNPMGVTRMPTGSVDLTLVGWILLFLCRNLDHTMQNGGNGDDDKNARKDKDNGTYLPNRWSFLQGDMSGQPNKSKVKQSMKSYRRCLQKRIFHHKQKLQDLEQAKKKFLASQAEKYSQSLSSEAQALFKQHEQQFKKISQYASKIRKTDGEHFRKMVKDDSCLGIVKDANDVDADSSLILPRERCLPVVRGLVTLILSMDSTCSVDLFLVASKVLARICLATRPAICLSEAMTQDQLQQLILLAANQDFNHGTVAWGGPWAGHAITCLLQDILDGERLYPASSPLEGVTDDDISAAVNDKLDSLSGSLPIPSLDAMAVEAIDATDSELGQSKESTSKTNLDFLLEENEYDDDAAAKFQEFMVGVQSKPPPGLDCDEGSIQSVQSADGNNTPDALASVYYPDEKKQKMKQCKSKFDYGKSLLGPQGLSAAVDFRLELGLQLQAELGLRVMLSYQMVSVQGAFNARLPLAPPIWHFFQPFQFSSTDDELSEIIQCTSPTQFQTTSSAGMLCMCYDHMTSQLLSQQVHLDTLLQLWLMLNEDSNHEDAGVSSGQPVVFDSSKTPLIMLNPSFVNTLLEALSYMPNIPVRTWVLAFQTLTLLCNQWVSHGNLTVGKPMASVILSNPNFMNVLIRFLSSSTNTGPSALTLRYQQVGPSAAKAFYEFLQRLEVKAPEQMTLKELLLKLVYVLTADRGAFYNSSGPLDAQCRFLDFVLCLKYEQVDVSNAISVVEAISSLVHQHILCQELVVCRKAGDDGINARFCFGGLFASLFRGVDTSSNTGDASRDRFMCSLVKLVNILVQIPLPARFSRNPPQTDTAESTSTHHLPNLSTPFTAAPMPDSAKLSHVLASSPLRNLSRSDDEKEQETFEEKGVSASSGLGGQPAGDPNDNTTYLADIIVGHQQIMSSLIHTLSYCSSSPMASLICNGIGASSSCWYDTFGIGEPLSVGDGVYQILVTLTNKCSDIKLVLESLFVYLSSGGRQYVQGHSLCRLSDPLLWFILKVLNNSNAVKMFLQMGAVDVICNNLVSCSQKIVNTSPGLISTMMQNLNNSNNSRLPSAHRLNVNSTNTDCNDILQNFAPLGSISSSSPTATPAEVLIQASPPHRRARSAAWSYHFYPDETWVDLTIQLPFAILLKEVQISPHNTSLSTCPSYVSLEVSHDGITVTPMSAPLMTCSLGFIRLQLIRPEVVTMVTIRLHRARDSMTIGLSQILLMGHSAFSETNQKPASILAPTDDVVSKTSLGWVQLLQHCLTVEESIASAAAAIPHLLTTCTALLVSPQASTHSHHLETVLLKLGLHSTDMGLTLIYSLLRKPSFLGQPDDSVSFMGKVSGVANDSTIEILYQLGTLQDSGTPARLKALIVWLGDSAEVALQKSEMLSLNNGYGPAPHEAPYFTLPHPAAPHVHCIAAILWYSHSLPVRNELRTIITPQLFRSVYEWSTVLSFDSSLKRAVDNVLCSVCYIYPSFFTLILEWMGILLNPSNSMTASISDDCKDSSQQQQHISMTDDSKEAQTNQQSAMAADQDIGNNLITLHDFSNMMLDRSHLSTLAITCQSPGAVQQLLASKFPAILAQGLFEFCNHEIACFAESLTNPESLTDANKSMMGENGSVGEQSYPHTCDNSTNGLTVTADLVAAILGFFAEITREPMIKDWMGSAEGSIFWPVLLTLLCTIPVQAPRTTATTQTSSINYKHKMMTAEERAAIETVVITFFNQVISCHSQNQHLFARVLCEVIKEQGSGPISSGPLLSGFTRRMFLQVLLEEPKILVSFKSSPHNSRLQVQGCFSQLQHPCFGAGRHFHTVTVGLQTNCEELINKISDHTGHMAQFWDGTVEKKNIDDNKKDMTELGIEVVDFLSNAAGLLAKERREKNSNHNKTGGPPRLPPRARGNQNTDMVAVNLQFPVLSLYHNLLPGQPLPAELTLSQLLVILQEKGYPQGQAVLEFLLRFHSKPGDKKTYRDPDWPEANNPDDLLLKADSFPSALQVFASVGGLALLAEHLPVLYSEVSRQPVLPDTMESTAVSDVSQDQWVSVDSSDLNETFYEPVPTAPPLTSQSGGTAHSGLSTIPPHSLIAFGLFLRLPGYADVLLQERKKAQCLLRLVLGVTDDGDGGHILTSPIANSLPTLPFNVIESLFDTTPLTTDDGVYLRRMMLDIGALHLILACLSVLSHHGPRVNSAALQHETQTMLAAIQVANTQTVSSTAAEEKSQQYWAKGTGFGTGSTTSSWDAEQSLLRQKSEEEHVTCLLQVIASYINPSDRIPRDFDGVVYPSQCHNLLPEVVPELLSQSCLVPAISSYLRNDSVLDMARHVPLYKALLELLRGIAICPMLVPLLLPLDKSEDGETTVSVCTLLEKMRGCVDTYANRLKSNKSKGSGTAAANNTGNGSGTSTTSKEEEEENEGLALLIPDIQETARIVQMATDKLKGSNDGSSADKSSRAEDKNLCSSTSLENRYINVMKSFQFETYEMVTENDSFMKFSTPHHYESNVRTSGFIKNPSRARRLAQEAVTLSTSLPLSASSSVFVRCDEDRLDIMKVLITGPADTPYANGCFEFDVYFPQDYPISPPFINLETTGNHSVRFNPNLYNDGKVCLSVLNTWHGRPEEKWNPQTSSFLQVLVSIQSLILVSEPYFNEPGYERSRGTPSGTASSREYDANIRQATVKWAMLEQIRDPSPCFKEVIQNHFWLKRHEILSQCEQWICEMESYSHDKRTGRHIAHSTLALKRHYNHLREEFSKMDPPSGMEGEVADIPEETKPEFSHSKSYTELDVEEGPTQVEPINLDITDPISVLESLPFGPNSIDC